MSTVILKDGRKRQFYPYTWEDVDDKDGTLNQSARETIAAEWNTNHEANHNYATKRRYGKKKGKTNTDNVFVLEEKLSGYKSISDQLDLLWHDVDDGKFGADAKTGEFYKDIKAVKDRFPKG